MVGMNYGDKLGAYQAAQKPEQVSNKTEKPESVDKAENYGRTIGEPKLSDTAKKYYDQLKKKFGNYDFILVSSDQMENAKANAAKYANGHKTVVLIDEAKVEKMATDKDFRKKYEGILSGAEAQIEQLKASLEKSGAASSVKGFGIQLNEDGTTSLFAVLKKSSDAQKSRIEESLANKRAAKKEAAKKAAKKENEERVKKSIEEKREERIKTDDKEKYETVSADSIEELMKKIEDFNFTARSNNVQTEAEKLLGQNIDFKG